MKKLIIEGIDLLEIQNKSVLLILATKLVKSYRLMEKLVEKTNTVDIDNDIFFDNIKIMFSVESFKDKFDKMLLENTLCDNAFNTDDYDEF